DYDVVRRAIGYIREHWRKQPDIEAIAAAAGVTPTELHHLFRRWAGLTPKAFLQTLTLDGARQLLRALAAFEKSQHQVGEASERRLQETRSVKTALQEYTFAMREGLEAKLAMIGADPRCADAAERKILRDEMKERRVDRGA